MAKIKKICVITYAYPYPGVSVQPFVEQLVNAFLDMGVDCDVVVPRSVTNSVVRHIPLPERHITMSTKNGVKYDAYFPRYITLSSIKGLLSKYVSKLNYYLFTKAVKKTVKRNNITADLFYAHFFEPSGFSAADMSEKYSKPFFVACGENYLTTLDDMGLDWVRDKVKNISGVIAVSSNNKLEVLKRNIVTDDKIGVFVNSIDTDLFNRKNKSEMRRKYKVDENAFVVCFVGRFLEVKGPLRLSAALDNTDDVYSIFLGTGSQVPDCKNILYCGAVLHDQVPEYLSMSDVFVLPTLAEGCCNAIIEAMACGLPIISSNLPFNDDILDDEWSIRVDPTDINAIKDAIIYLRDNKEARLKMAEAALKKAEGLNIVKRAENILNFMEAKM